MLFWRDSVSKHRSASICEGSKLICCEFEVNARRTKNHHFGAAGGADGAGGVVVCMVVVLCLFLDV